MRILDDFHVIITCMINGTEVNFDIMQFVNNYRLHGGPEQPIRYVTMEVNKINIDNITTTVGTTTYRLMDNIIQGQTKMKISAVGTGSFIITKVELSEYIYEITAYGVEVIFNSMVLSNDMIKALMQSGTATQLVGTTSQIAQILVDAWFGEGIPEFQYVDSVTSQTITIPARPGLDMDYNVHLSSSFEPDTPGGTSKGNDVAFEAGMSFLNIIQVCALIENAFVFFGDEYVSTDYMDTFFFVNYDDSLPIASNPASTYSDGTSMDGVLNVYPALDDPYELYSETDVKMYSQAVALASQTSEGADTIVNLQVIQIQSDDEQIVNVSNDDGDIDQPTYTGATASQASYGEYGGTVLKLPQLRGVYPSGSTTSNIEENAKAIANNMVRRYRDPSQSIVIMMAETNVITQNGAEHTAWEMAFDPFSHTNYINDDVNNIHLSYYHTCDKALFEGQTVNKSKDNALLRISTFSYCYPELATRYRFGVAKQADLTQTIATLQKSAS